jgi:hypothetical protein
MPKCGRKTEVYSRIVGYLRPVQNWNEGKVAEFHHRRTLDRGWQKVAPDVTDPAGRAEPEASHIDQLAAG